MKKQYITPQIECVCAVTINIMDFSITIDGKKYTFDVNGYWVK